MKESKALHLLILVVITISIVVILSFNQFFIQVNTIKKTDSQIFTGDSNRYFSQQKQAARNCVSPSRLLYDKVASSQSGLTYSSNEESMRILGELFVDFCSLQLPPLWTRSYVSLLSFESQDPIKVDIQKAVLKSWSLLPKNIKLVLFTDSEYWKERAREVNIDWSDAFEYLEHEPS